MNSPASSILMTNEKEVVMSAREKSIDIEPALKIIYREKLFRKLKFISQYQADKSEFKLDNENKISRIDWVGTVTKKSSSKLLVHCIESIEYQGFNKLVINLSKLTEIDTESRIIIKELLISRGSRLKGKLEKVGIVNAKSYKGKIFSDMISLVFSMNLPNCEIQKFDRAEEGIEWFLS